MSCEKITYETFFEAQSAVNKAGNIGRARNRQRAKKIPKRAYKCEHCNKYHLTSQKSKVKKHKPR